MGAKKRGVKVEAILDKSNRSDRYSAATFLKNQGVDVLIDDKHAIAHNKIMIIDDAIMITGSFNFTKAAEESHAENLLILRDQADLVRQYVANQHPSIIPRHNSQTPKNKLSPSTCCPCFVVATRPAFFIPRDEPRQPGLFPDRPSISL
jgi:phosphatidylserine/phosphatidylglycerophosphate/cardiolipin synthase-like enzyme